MGRKGAFAVENVDCALETNGGNVADGLDSADPLIMHVGDLSKITELHSF